MRGFHENEMGEPTISQSDEKTIHVGLKINVIENS